MNGRKAFLLSALVVAWMVVVTLLLWPRSSPPMESVSSYSSEVIPIDSETGPGFASRGQLAISAPGRADSRFNVTVSYNASGLGAIEVRVAMGRILPGSFSNTSASAASLSFAVVPEPRQGHSDAWVNVTVARGGESASLSVKYQATRVIMLTVKEVGGRMPRIDFIPDDDRAALVIFYSKATNESMASMRKGTKRVVTFMDVDYVWREWPSGFDPNTKTPLESFHRRCRYCYQHMVRAIPPPQKSNSRSRRSDAPPQFFTSAGSGSFAFGSCRSWTASNLRCASTRIRPSRGCGWSTHSMRWKPEELLTWRM